MEIKSHSPLGFFGIIRESFKTTSRNKQLFFPILLVVFLSFSQLDFAQVYVVGPVAKDLKSQLAIHPSIFHHKFAYSYTHHTTYFGALTDVREIFLVLFLILTISSIVTLIVFIATVSSSSEAYTAKALDLKEMFSKLKTNWKRPIVTSFYMFLFSSGIVFLYLIAIVMTSILAENKWGIWSVGVMSLSIPICYFYIAALWIVSMVVSVLEEDVGGLKAIGRASELMKGRRLHASVMMVVFAVAYCVVHLMANALESYNLSMAITIPFRNVLLCWLQMFMFVVYTIFYHEWKTIDEEKEGKGFYLPITTCEA